MNTPVPIQHTQKPLSFNPRLTPSVCFSYHNEYPSPHSAHTETPQFQSSPHPISTTMNTPVPIQHTQKPLSFNPRLTPDQEASLESQFSRAKTLHATDLEILAAEMGVDDKEVKIKMLDFLLC
ncbi:hypothetical protein M8J75_012886 [Diaphorina citri]|nr:hypothetical protein M8J75_012886 [Diaphorina citri]